MLDSSTRLTFTTAGTPAGNGNWTPVIGMEIAPENDPTNGWAARRLCVNRAGRVSARPFGRSAAMADAGRAHAAPALGFTLIEVLIAMAMIAFGLLAIAGMQVQMMKGTTASRFRSMATFHVNEIADRMRANVQGYASGAYVTTGNYGARAGVEVDPGWASPGWLRLTYVALSPADTAARDLALWQSAIAHGAAGGAGFVSGTLATGFTIVVAWREPRESADVVINDSAPLRSARPATCAAR